MIIADSTVQQIIYLIIPDLNEIFRVIGLFKCQIYCCLNACFLTLKPDSDNSRDVKEK